MKNIRLFLLIPIITLFLSSCGSSTETRTSVLMKCTTLGNESIAYARANYVKLFHYFNPKKFEKTYEKVKSFDNVTARNVINTYEMAVRKIKHKDPTTVALVSACTQLADFSKNLVDQTYPRALSHKSQYDPLTNNFFNEINNIVKFDHNIGQYNKNERSFKQQVAAYQLALKTYKAKFKSSLSSED